MLQRFSFLKRILTFAILPCLLMMSFITGSCGCARQNTEERVKDGVMLEGGDVGGMTRKELDIHLSKCAVSYDQAPDDPSYDPKSWEITGPNAGRKLDITATIDDVMNAESGTNIKFKVITLNPGTVAPAANPIVKIASFTTEIIDTRESRKNNIKLAAEEINNTKIEPGREFSFNGVVGRRTGAKGYREAPIIIRTEDGPKKGMGVGGGICQLSTTIYNAAESCGLEITERHLHSKKVPYVLKGDDATVSYGKADLKFRNNREYTIMIKTILKTDALTVEIYENRAALKSFAIIRIETRSIR